MKLFNILFGLTCICTVLTSCRDSESGKHKVTFVGHDLMIKFTDNELDSAIDKYISVNDVNPKERILSLSVYRDPARHIFYLTQIRRRDLAKSVSPDYFFIHNDQFLVLIRLGGGDFFKSSNVVSQLDSAMQQLGITLAEDSLDYDPPTWEFIRECSSRLTMRKKSGFTLNYIPCGYEIKQDSLQQNNFSIIAVDDYK